MIKYEHRNLKSEEKLTIIKPNVSIIQLCMESISQQSQI